ncbi:hypothetical protein GCM10011583_60460 [Streptomyces camponoticapitis]|uniref:Uncharacterized protein n=1 Tax=Streptomyces camponoticapitis TaxID=1616125 RepID=A0ABQ2EQQ8_9ACTN|nr:hypothetical protein GCM10011583_60460 [Streptomyces camponoticapitis]
MLSGPHRPRRGEGPVDRRGNEDTPGADAWDGSRLSGFAGGGSKGVWSWRAVLFTVGDGRHTVPGGGCGCLRVFGTDEVTELVARACR